MHNVDFTAMQRQLTPSPQARAALEARLASAAPRRRSSRWKYGLLAACIALALCAAPLVRQYFAPQHAVQSGTQGGISYEEYAAQEGTLILPKLNIWDTQLPSESSANSYAAGEGVNRDAVQSDLEALFGGSVPGMLGWEGLSDLWGYLAFGPPKGAKEAVQPPLDELFYGHFYASCDWGKFTLMVGGLGTTVSPDLISRPEDYPGDALTVIDGVEVRAARFTDSDGTSYGEVSFTMKSGYSVFYSVNTSSSQQTEELLSRLVQLAVVEEKLDPQALTPEGTSSNTGDAPAQAGALPYEDLMAYFSAQYGPNCYPDWFAGAWLDSVSGNLVVALAEGYDAAPLEQEVREAAGAAVTFSTARYSYAHLLSLQDQIDRRMQEEGTAYASWVDVMENRVRLELDTASSDLLAFLARLDPAGDAVQVTEGSAPTTDACYDTLPGAD